MRDEGELQWFLGIRVSHDITFKMREKHRLHYRLKSSTHTTDKPMHSRSTYIKEK
ncbi:hypothetical protein Egran_04725 [Elaphomyces granulatus]|uniref:Uncharacterized protein n=1 Tax=Elaphomyces granulatus TaxID=519963 RepID=A0A232LU09_9EURO|nr:hypothetical protein Egran_04725 [Elaphomyces granulatus]